MEDMSLQDSMNKTSQQFRQDREQEKFKAGILKRIDALEKEINELKQSPKKQKG